jgi:hypothetical protein
MSVYNPATPNAIDLISATQQPIKDNFFQLNAQFGIDHQAFSTGGVNGDGTHKQVTFDLPVVAAPTGNVSILHTVFGSNFFTGVPIAYFANSMGDYPLMPDLKTSGTFNSFQLSNIIVNYGTFPSSGSPQLITYPIGFSNTGYAIVFFGNSTTASLVTTLKTTGSITVASTQGGSYIAIGI